MFSLLNKQLHRNLLHLLHKKQPCIYSQRLVSVISSNEINMQKKVSGRFASNEQKRIIKEFVTESDATKLDWSMLKMSVLSISRGYINERNINGCILETCSQIKRLDLAKSYMKYVKKCGQTKPNIALELLYFRSCYESRDQLIDDDRFEIEATCKLLYKNNSHLMNSTLIEGLVMGLCCTSSWRDSLEYLKALKNENDVSITTLICIVLKAFEEAETDLGWTLTQKLYNQHGVLPLEIFSAWFNISEHNLNYNYLKVLEFLRDNECVIKVDLAELIREKLKQYGNKITTTMIYHNKGQCKTCNKLLKPVEITDSEFKMLQEQFMSNVMIGKNIFNNSSPQELQDFQDFIEITAPYDVVVDGLNLAYAYRGKIDHNSLDEFFFDDHLSSDQFLEILVYKTKLVMKSFIKNKLKVLLIGRKHLATMLGKDFEFIKKNAHIFFTSDLSKDDPFVLYATMYSGLGTKVLTRDLMRGHKFLLGDSMVKSVFQKWLHKHRLQLKIRPGNEVFVRDPITYLLATQESAGGIWHVPYEEFKEPGSWSKPNTTPDNWMCIKTLMD